MCYSTEIQTFSQTKHSLTSIISKLIVISSIFICLSLVSSLRLLHLIVCKIDDLVSPSYLHFLWDWDNTILQPKYNNINKNNIFMFILVRIKPTLGALMPEMLWTL